MATFTAQPPVCSELRLFSIQGFKGTDAVFFNGTASKFKVVSDTYLTAVVPKGATIKKHTVSNPTIGYGFHTIKYANGKSREFFQIGVSGNKTGFSVYILGLKDKKYLAKTYGRKLGKASVTGYCIRFKALKDINIDTLEAAIRYGLAAQNEKKKVS